MQWGQLAVDEWEHAKWHDDVSVMGRYNAVVMGVGHVRRGQLAASGLPPSPG